LRVFLRRSPSSSTPCSKSRSSTMQPSGPSATTYEKSELRPTCKNRPPGAATNLCPYSPPPNLLTTQPCGAGSLEAQRARMRAAREERNTLALSAGRLIPSPSCACSLEAQRARLRAAKRKGTPADIRAGRLTPSPSCACSLEAAKPSCISPCGIRGSGFLMTGRKQSSMPSPRPMVPLPGNSVVLDSG